MNKTYLVEYSDKNGTHSFGVAEQRLQRTIDNLDKKIKRGVITGYLITECNEELKKGE